MWSVYMPTDIKPYESMTYSKMLENIPNEQLANELAKQLATVQGIPFECLWVFNEDEEDDGEVSSSRY